MQQGAPNTSLYSAGFDFLILLYHSIVRGVRVKSGSAALGVLKEVLQILVFFGIFYLMYAVMGRSIAIRGDFVLFLLTGIFLLLTHMGAMRSVMSSATSISPIMLHAPMSVMLTILSRSISGLYSRIIAILFIFTGAYYSGADLTVFSPRGVILPVFLAWSSGIAVGMVLMTLRPLSPGFVGSFSMVYMRAQMITSGKIIPAAYMPKKMVDWFDWNPLFHCIDQARLATFVNYSREVSSPTYAIYFTIIFVTIGMMGEFWMRNNLSKSKHG